MMTTVKKSYGADLYHASAKEPFSRTPVSGFPWQAPLWHNDIFHDESRKDLLFNARKRSP